jgi:hypothetical protein
MSALAAIAAVGLAAAGVVQGTPAPVDAAFRPRRVAVLVGVQDYTDPALHGLRFATADATDLGALLRDPAVGAFDEVTVLTGADTTSRAALERALARATATLQRDDTFLLYLSGHGTLTLDPVEGSRLWFLPADARLDAPAATGLSVAALEDTLATLPARRRVLVLDTCHNGRGPAGSGRSVLDPATARRIASLRGEPPAPRSVREVSESEARLYAAQLHQPAMEDAALQHGVYTHFLMEALRSPAADLDGDGLVDVAEAHGHARDRTIAHTGGLQTPRAEYRIVGREEIWLAGDPRRRKAAERALLGATDALLAGARLLVDGVPRGAADGLVAVEAGRRELTLESAEGRVLASRAVHLSPGQSLALEGLLVPRTGPVATFIGTRAVHGPGAAAWHPLAPEAELAWIDPAALGPRLRWDLSLQAAAMAGPVAEQAPETRVSAGHLAAGLSAGPRLGAFSLGPQVLALVPWRRFTNETGDHAQGALTAGLGARAVWVQPVGRHALAVRLDSRWAPYTHDAARTALWHHGLAVGWVARP